MLINLNKLTINSPCRQYFICTVTVLWLSVLCLAQDSNTAVIELKRLGWDANAFVKQRFIHPPTFQFATIDNVASYRATIRWEQDNNTQKYVIESPNAAIDLTIAWKKLPTATNFHIRVDAIDVKQKVLGKTEFSFCKMPDFTRSYYRPKTSYMESGIKAGSWVIGRARDIKVGNYPGIFGASYVRLLTTVARLCPDTNEGKDALQVAVQYGKALLKESTPSDWVYANVPFSHLADTNSLQVNRIAMVGLAYSELYKTAGDKIFLDAAEHIAETLKKNQLPEGRWYFRVNPQTGKMLEDYTSDQVQAILLLDVLIRDYKHQEFVQTRDKAVQWMLKNPCKTFQWQQQWDDVAVMAPYENLEWYDTALFIEYLLRYAGKNNNYEQIAAELSRYIEDQFVEWEPDMCDRMPKTPPRREGDVFITPGALEQYFCYRTIDWHAAHYIRVCMDWHAYTEDDIYLKKAKAMADVLVYVQHPDGFYPTWMQHKLSKENPRELRDIFYRKIWANCTSYTGEILMKLGEYLNRSNVK